MILLIYHMQYHQICMSSLIYKEQTITYQCIMIISPALLQYHLSFICNSILTLFFMLPTYFCQISFITITVL